MLPKFPQFKKLEVTDQKDIEAFTFKYQPYSDFNFEVMLSWDINNSIEVSDLRGNLILLYKNVFTEELSCSYFGNSDLNETIQELFDFIDTKGINPQQITLVPEVFLKGIDFNRYFIEIDINSSDYIYDIKELAAYDGNKFIKKRGKINNFIRNYPNSVVKILDLEDQEIRNEILGLNNSWLKNRTEHDMDFDNIREPIAVKNFLGANFKNILCVGLYDNNKLIGYSIFSFHSKDYAISHFTKADVSYKGVYEFLMKENAMILRGKGCKFLNYQEDMGLPGLRIAKSSYRPIGFLRKYFIKSLR